MTASLPEQLRAIASQETKPPLWIWITKEQAPALTRAAARLEELEAALRDARARLEKGRALWNGPCHETAWVLDAALKSSSPTQE